MEFNSQMWNMIVSQGVFGILFVWLLINTRKESKEREDRLMKHLERTTDIIEELSKKLEKKGLV